MCVPLAELTADAMNKFGFAKGWLAHENQSFGIAQWRLPWCLGLRNRSLQGCHLDANTRIIVNAPQTEGDGLLKAIKKVWSWLVPVNYDRFCIRLASQPFFQICGICQDGILQTGQPVVFLRLERSCMQFTNCGSITCRKLAGSLCKRWYLIDRCCFSKTMPP